MSKIEIHKDDLEALDAHYHIIAHASLAMKEAHEEFITQGKEYLDICEKKSQSLLLAEQNARVIINRVMKKGEIMSDEKLQEEGLEFVNKYISKKPVAEERGGFWISLFAVVCKSGLRFYEIHSRK